MQQRPLRRVQIESKPYGFTKADLKLVDPPTPAQRDQQGLLRIAERQARTLRLQTLHGVAFQPTTERSGPQVVPIIAVPRPRVPYLVHMYIWNGSTNLHSKAHPFCCWIPVRVVAVRVVVQNRPLPTTTAAATMGNILHYGPVKKQIKVRSNQVIKFIKPIVHYGFLPLVIYLGLNTEPQADLLMVLLPWVQPDAPAGAEF
ncbi:hypothetical protein H257_10770 [Aphanomyces astaci]|uniref:Mitochondrial import receptor subunit TOM7 homolog n=2 Tax=Aphanomyces astaci TaxID=112090 RepID=W4G4K8_APHAT|nr:hypothetical protein H257_10770 [Aphanomyces astaci]ETV74637.1 hypothetical protein H257_10770 [Aphanomyces astaci]|eukprot:XP_009835724.1 hypothetical protein H257_10770 [Aphanomyces astaci]